MANFQNQDEKINGFLNSLQLLELNLGDLITADDITDYENAFEEIKGFVENDLCVDVNYYSEAAKFLEKYDSDRKHRYKAVKDYVLRTNFDILPNGAFDVFLEGLDRSEALASKIATEINTEMFYAMRDEITEFFDSLENSNH